ncbi:NUMOD3 domain-containing DNA-binding protein [Agrobacterium tumefaciens]|uniref:NUMOD3 domain-containing DNA-binding protein n=1 Tax=Agrobacterium tumefaciens TaxID=358 RepID=UPI002AFF8495|nr:NUMOD3 domain-containing DNA-binding protein [Agrobacterium tumefaciens]MEA1843043.1 NUMOD3 domain-containing DNA-binding protein [Agrobacterium tumefaciens]
MTYPIKKEKASAREVYERITKGSEQVDIDAAVEAALIAQFENARDYQESKGRKFELSLDHFLQKLATASRRKTMGKKMKTGNFDGFMKSNYGYVITWRSRKAFHTGVMDNETAIYLNRIDAERAAQFGPGDKHSEESIELIRIARTGTTQAEETKSKISKSMMGHEVTDEARQNMSDARKGKTDSEETKAVKSAKAKARWARYRAEKENTNG